MISDLAEANYKLGLTLYWIGPISVAHPILSKWPIWLPVIPSFGMLPCSENMERLNRVLQDRHPMATWVINIRGLDV